MPRTPPAAPTVAIPDRCSRCDGGVVRHDELTGQSHCYTCLLLHVSDGERSRWRDIVVGSDNVLRIDRDRAGGGVVCETCGKLYYDHPDLPGLEFLTVLCDGSAVKL